METLENGALICSALNLSVKAMTALLLIVQAALSVPARSCFIDDPPRGWS
ncbi:MAG: hypothetical protein ACREDL_10505 [Bradyrhizobium sp.]